jgi:hypothetical protein
LSRTQADLYAKSLNVGDPAGTHYHIVDESGNILLGGTSALAATVDEINRVADVSTRLVNCAAATLALTTALHDGKIVTLNKADGQAITLPAATGSGSRFRLFIGTTITSVGTTIKVVGNDIMVGLAKLLPDSGTTGLIYATAADTDTITLDGSTTGGIKGMFIDLIDIAADTWSVLVEGTATGSEATPFSATVTP